MTNPYALAGCIENAEHGHGITLLGGWVRLPAAALASGGVRLRLTVGGKPRGEWPLSRLMTRRDLPAQGQAPAGRGFQLLLRGLPDWAEGTLDVLHAGGEIPLHPPGIRPEPFRPRGHLDGADAREAWGWLVHAPGTEAVIEMDGAGRLPVRCDVHRADLPFDDGSALPAFGFHLSFAGTALAAARGPRRVSLRAGGVTLGDVLVGGPAARAAEGAIPLPPAASRVSAMLSDRAAGQPAAPRAGARVSPSPLVSPLALPRVGPMASPLAAPPLAGLAPGVPRPAASPLAASAAGGLAASAAGGLAASAAGGLAASAAVALALEACQAIGTGHLLVSGMLDWAGEAQAPLLDLLPQPPGTAAPSVILFPPADAAPPGRSRRRFVLVGVRPASAGQPGGALALRVRAAGQPASFPLPGDAHGPSPGDVLHKMPGEAVFDLLRAAAAGGPAAASLTPSLGTAGAFTRWLSAVPWLEPADFTRVEAWASPSGECGLGLTLDPLVGPGTALRLLAVLPEAGRIRPMAVTQAPPLCSETMLLAYGAMLDIAEAPVPAFELLMELRHAGEAQWFRVNPQPVAAPHLLDALHRHAGLPEGPDLAATLDWLRNLLDQRLESFAALLLAAPPPLPPGDGPRLLVLHGLDDPYAVRLLAMAASEIEARAEAVLLLGPREFTQAAAELFLQRGRITAHAGAGLPALLDRRGGARADGRVALLDVLALAKALETHSLDAALVPRLPAATLPMLARVAAVAGLPDAADAVARLAGAIAGADAGAQRSFGPEDGAAAGLVAAHLHAIWRGVAPLFQPEAADGTT